MDVTELGRGASLLGSWRGLERRRFVAGKLCLRQHSSEGNQNFPACNSATRPIEFRGNLVFPALTIYGSYCEEVSGRSSPMQKNHRILLFNFIENMTPQHWSANNWQSHPAGNWQPTQPRGRFILHAGNIYQTKRQPIESEAWMSQQVGITLQD